MARPQVTAVCDEDLAAIPPGDALALLDKLIEGRAQAPEAGDLINNLRERPCYSLHAGRYRAATWYDASRDVVWLLAAGLHRSCSRDDFYAVVTAREQAGRLYPSPGDYAVLDQDEWRDSLAQEALALRRLREDVLNKPDAGVQRYTSGYGLYAEMWVESTTDLALLVVRLRLQRLSGEWIKATELAILLEGPLGTDPQTRPDEDWRFRTFEEYLP